MEQLVVVLGPFIIVAVFVLGLIIAILYLFLPFAIFGIKPLLLRNNILLNAQNKLLEEQLDLLYEKLADDSKEETGE